MPEPSPAITLNNGVALPALGLGVFQSPPAETAQAVEAALRTGYRLIDTAAAYGNEREVGEGIRRSGIARDDVFIETKVWISDYGYEVTLHAFEKSARKLGVEQLDLLILHQALPSAFDRTLDAYRALEKLLADGRVRAIGVSNFMPEHLDRLLSRASVVPAVNQIEVHPYFQQGALQRMHKEHGIVTQGWSPIGGITSYRGMEKRTFDDPTLVAIAKQCGKSPAISSTCSVFQQPVRTTRANATADATAPGPRHRPTPRRQDSQPPRSAPYEQRPMHHRLETALTPIQDLA